MERTGSDIDRDTQLERPKVFASPNGKAPSLFISLNIPFMYMPDERFCQRRSTDAPPSPLDALRMQIKVTQVAPAMNSSHRQLATVAESLAKRVGRRLRRQPVMQAQFLWRSKSLASQR
ncbi:unnamed protein product [Musa hybrid cultivar]